MTVNPQPQNKRIQWKVLTIAVASMFIFLNLNIFDFTSQDAAAGSPPPSDTVNGVQYIQGDWNVYTTESYTDEIIDLTGNLYIHKNGVLKFQNVTLRMNVTSSTFYEIRVYDGGKFLISDGDNDPATTTDCSNITDSIFDVDNLLTTASDYRYLFFIDVGGILEIKNSILREIGTDFMSYTTHTLNVNSATITMQNCTFSNSIGVYINSNYDINRRNALIENTTFKNSLFGVVIEWSRNVDLKFNKFYNLDYIGLYYYNVYNLDISNCTFTNISSTF
ncbi:MAG: right-handed parallel beta-helix repeat-containing protein, partial [Thermoplasmata archaeon]